MSELEKLRKELDRKVKGYEGKLATLTAINSALQTENDKLRKQVAEAKPATAADDEIEELKVEFARRLGASDRHVSQLQDEIYLLRQQLQLASQGGSATEARLHEKDQHIRTLQVEGEKLSRKNGELEAASRKLRVQLRDAEAERDRLAQRLAAVEAQMSEQAQRLSDAEYALAEQSAAYEARLEGVQRQAHARVSKLEAAAADEKHRSMEQAARETAEALAASMEREAALSSSISELRKEMDAKEEREADLRGEMSVLEGRVRELEAVNHALQSNTTDATRPLLRQIESLAAAASVQQQAARETEQRLTERLRAAEGSLAAASDARRTAMTRAEAAEAAAAAARDAAHTAAAAVAGVKAQCEAEQARCLALQQQVSRLEEQLRSASQASKELLKAKDEELETLQERVWDAEEQLRAIAAAKRVSHAADKQRQDAAAAAAAAEAQQEAAAQQQQQQHWPNGQSAQQQQQQGTAAGEGSRAANLGRQRGAEGGEGSREPAAEGDEMDEMLRSMSLNPSTTKLGAHPISPRGSFSGDFSKLPLVEAQLELLQNARDAANEALAQALGRATKLEAAARRCAKLEAELKEFEAKQALLLEVLGERNERVDQLEEDCKDMRRIFHEQLQVAVDQLQEARSALEQCQWEQAQQRATDGTAAEADEP